VAARERAGERELLQLVMLLATLVVVERPDAQIFAALVGVVGGVDRRRRADRVCSATEKSAGTRARRAKLTPST
jgi:hypothetical protein